MASGVPKQCDQACANLWVPFADKCGKLILAMGADFGSFTRACKL